MNDSGLLRITRLTDEEITGTDTSAGIIEKYFSLSQENTACLQDLSLGAGEMKVGDNYLCLHTLPIRKTCRRAWRQTHATSVYPPTEATAACHLPLR